MRLSRWKPPWQGSCGPSLISSQNQREPSSPQLIDDCSAKTVSSIVQYHCLNHCLTTVDLQWRLVWQLKELANSGTLYVSQILCWVLSTQNFKHSVTARNENTSPEEDEDCRGCLQAVFEIFLVWKSKPYLEQTSRSIALRGCHWVCWTLSESWDLPIQRLSSRNEQQCQWS